MEEIRWYEKLDYTETKDIIKEKLQNMSRDFVAIGFYLKLIRDFSTHILTRRMTAILNKNTLSKTARIIPFEYNTLKIYIFSNSYLLFFWKSTPFSGANLQEDFCALIIRTKISKYP